jgi:hypothetical protein
MRQRGRPSCEPARALVLFLLAHVTCAGAWKYSPLQEKYALIDLQRTASTTSSSDWDQGWDHNTNQCTGNWRGVRCNAGGYVSSLNLGSSDLGGEMFDRFYFFRDLEQLFVDRNDVTARLPASIGSLSRLAVLDMSNNNFVGTIPASWGSLSNLKRLVLRGNPELTGSLPAALLTADKQEVRFELDGTQLKGAVGGFSGSTGNNGGVPYKAALLEKGAASNYPSQRRRVTGVGDSLYRSGL